MQLENKIPWNGLLVGVYIFSVPVFSYSESLGLNKIPQLISGLVILSAIYSFIRRQKFNRNLVVVFYSLFTIWSAISYYYSDYNTETESLFTLIKVTIITGCCSYIIKEESEFLTCFFIFFFSIFITSLMNFEDIIQLRGIESLTEEERFAGTFQNANTASLYCLGVIWTGFILLFNMKIRTFVKVVIYTGIVIACTIIIYTGSRKGLLGLGFISITLAWFINKKIGTTFFKRLLIAIVLLICIGLLFIVIYNSPYYFRISTMFSGEVSSVAREYLIKQAIITWLSSYKNFFVGVGYDNFKYYNELYVYSHSTISETLVCTGIIGFFLYFSGLFSNFLIFFGIYKVSDFDTRITIILVFIILLLILFFNFSAVMFDDRLFMPLLGIFYSYALILKRNHENVDNIVSDDPE